jgi:hypothetical protein
LFAAPFQFRTEDEDYHLQKYWWRWTGLLGAAWQTSAFPFPIFPHYFFAAFLIELAILA